MTERQQRLLAALKKLEFHVVCNLARVVEPAQRVLAHDVIGRSAFTFDGGGVQIGSQAIGTLSVALRPALEPDFNKHGVLWQKYHPGERGALYSDKHRRALKYFQLFLNSFAFE